MLCVCYYGAPASSSWILRGLTWSIADQGEGFLDSIDLAECHTIPWQCQPSGRQSSPWGQARSGHRRGCGGHQPFNSMEDTCLILKPSSRWSRWVQWKFTSPVPGTSTVTQYVPAPCTMHTASVVSYEIPLASNLISFHYYSFFCFNIIRKFWKCNKVQFCGQNYIWEPCRCAVIQNGPYMRLLIND